MASQVLQVVAAAHTLMGRLWSHANSWGPKTHARLERLRAERRVHLVEIAKRGSF